MALKQARGECAVTLQSFVLPVKGSVTQGWKQRVALMGNPGPALESPILCNGRRTERIWLCRWPRRAALPTSEKLLAMHRRVKGSFLPTSDPPVALQGPINGVTQHYLVLHDGGNIWQTLNNSGTTWDEQIQPFRFSYQQTWLCFTEGKRFIYLRFSAMAASLKGRENNCGLIY